MDVVSYPYACANLEGLMDRVVRDRAPVVITRRHAEAVVMVPLAEWRALAETMHLLSTRANAERLRASIAEFGNAPPVAGEGG